MVNKTWRLASVSGLVFGLALSGMAHAQLIDEEDKDDPTQKPTNSTVWDAKQLQRLDRNVRKLERSVARIEAKNGPPVLIEPDPEVIALQASVARLSQKIDDQAQSLTRLTGALEDANHKLALAEAQQVRLDTATHRLELLEAHMKDVDQALAPPPPPPASTGTAEGDFSQAFGLYSQGKLDEAARAFEAFIQTWPEATQRAEAWFHLGQIRATKSDTSGATQALATALKGWPKAAWAPEATVDLVDVLLSTNRPTEACTALGEFTRRYAAFATSDVKIRAKAQRLKAKCT